MANDDPPSGCDSTELATDTAPPVLELEDSIHPLWKEFNDWVDNARITRVKGLDQELGYDTALEVCRRFIMNHNMMPPPVVDLTTDEVLPKTPPPPPSPKKPPSRRLKKRRMYVEDPDAVSLHWSDDEPVPPLVRRRWAFNEETGHMHRKLY